ncbi:MAG: hypothetical protein OXH04_02570 [Acidobacteria bacterium]|nr:hypothetical protein [Acidobacteriota bacterium]
MAVKSAASARQQDFRGLEELARLSGDRFVRGIVLCTGTTVVPLGRNLHQMPVSQVWA